MKYNPLLQKQIAKHLTAESLENPSLKAFIESINDTYLTFEKELEICKHTYREYKNENTELKDRFHTELEIKKLALHNLNDILAEDHLNHEVNPESTEDLLQLSLDIKAQISQRKLNEIALQEKNKELANFKYAIDQSALVCVTDEKGVIKTVNDQFCEKSQFSREEIIGNLHSIIDSKYHSREFFEDLWKTISSGQIWKGVIKNKGKNGEYYWVGTTIIPFLDQNSNPFMYTGVCFEITDIKNTEAEQIQQKKLDDQNIEHNRLIINASLNAIVTVDSAKIITFWNPQAETIFGWSKAEAIGKNMIDLIIPQRYRDIWNNLIENYQTDENEERAFLCKYLEMILSHKSGKEFYAETSIIPIYHGDSIHFSGFIQDISARKTADKQLQNNVLFLNSLLSNINAGIIAFNDENEILFLNQSFCNLRDVNFPASEFIGQKVWEFGSTHLGQYDADAMQKRMKEIVQAKKIVKDEIIKGPNGSMLERSYYPIEINSKETIHLLKITDVTLRYENEKLLKDSEERNRLILNSSLNSIITVDSSKKIIFWNPQAEIIFGWKPEEVLGKNLVETIIPARYRVLCHAKIDGYKENKEAKNEFIFKNLEYILLHKSGKEFFAETTLVPFHQNDITYFSCFVQDITSRKIAEKQLENNVLFLNSLLSNINSGIAAFNDANEIVYLNQAFCTMRNITIPASELIGKNALEVGRTLLNYKEPADMVNRMIEMVKSKKFIKGEIIPGTNGHTLERDYIPIEINAEETIHLLKITDVTERAENEKLLKDSEERNRLILNASLNAIITVDDFNKIIFWNPQAENIFGWKQEEVLGKT